MGIGISSHSNIRDLYQLYDREISRITIHIIMHCMITVNTQCTINKCVCDIDIDSDNTNLILY